MNKKLSIKTLTERTKLPLAQKISISKDRIIEWYEAWDGNVHVAFSGGKDSTVLLHLVRQLYPEVRAMFVNTGLEYPEVIKFVRSVDNVDSIRPKLSFKEILEKYGYPFPSKSNAYKLHQLARAKSKKVINSILYGYPNSLYKLPEKWKFLIDAPFRCSSKCCDYMKKKPSYDYDKKNGTKSFVGTMASDSFLRKISYIQVGGCNAFDVSHPRSTPLAIWTEEDIWKYINKYNIKYSSIYDMGYNNTGCMFCMFGISMEKEPNRFQKMKKTHPKHYKYCMYDLGLKKILDYCNIHF